MNNCQPNKFLIEHDSRFEHSTTGSGCIMLARLRPREDRGQNLLKFHISTEPGSTPTPCEDNFANQCHLVSIYREFSCVHIRAKSVVRTASGPDLDKFQDQIDWENLHQVSTSLRYWFYLAPSKYVHPGIILDRFVESNGLQPGTDPLSTLQATCSTLNSCLEYAPGSTTVDTPVERVLETGKGVCQDYAHVMLSLGRSWGIPCRYVSGYIYLEDSSSKRSRELASHAWAEFWLPKIGWVGFDPTNDSVVDQRYVRIAHGRDYDDAAPTRGIVIDAGNSTVRVSVKMQVLDEDDIDGKGRDFKDQVSTTTSPWKKDERGPHLHSGHDQ